MRKIYVLCIIIPLVCSCCGRSNRTDVALKELGNFYNFSTVDWSLIDTLYYRPYNCDWPEEIGHRIHPDFPLEYATLYWNRIQNAKTYLHQQTLPLRSGASAECIKQLECAESALDSVFVAIVSQEYYMRLFVDCYEEIMPLEIDHCFDSLSR